MKFFAPFLISFIVTYLAVPAVIRLAVKLDCFDLPGRRRFHAVKTPRGGGLAFFIGLASATLISMDMNRETASYLIASLVIVGIGTLDDWSPLGWKIKMASIAAAATIVVFGSDTVVRHIGAYGHFGRVELGAFSIPLTYFGIIGVTNAINLLDGLNGLAGGVSLLGFLFLGIAAFFAGNIPVALVCFAFVGALAAFLRYNFPRARTFMGDSGSMFLGFSLAVFSVHLTQDARFPVDPMYPVLVLLLPIFDALRVMIIRILKRKNPFKADKSHLHHLIVRKKVSPVAAVVLLWGVTVAFGSSALIMLNKTSTPFLVAALYGSLFLGIFAEALVRRKARKRHGEVGFPLASYRPYGYAGTGTRTLSPAGPVLHASVRMKGTEPRVRTSAGNRQA